MIKRFRIVDVLEKINLLKQDGSRFESLYMDMHEDVANDLLLDPDISNLMNARIYSIDTLEDFFGCRIFTHKDNDKRDIIQITTRIEVHL